jgi:hypothetical protein
MTCTPKCDCGVILPGMMCQRQMILILQYSLQSVCVVLSVYTVNCTWVSDEHCILDQQISPHENHLSLNLVMKLQ